VGPRGKKMMRIPPLERIAVMMMKMMRYWKETSSYLK